MVKNFREFGIDKPAREAKQSSNPRFSAIEPQRYEEDDKLISVKEETVLLKKLEEEMDKVHEESLRKNVLHDLVRNKHTRLRFLPGPM